jgi:hypothetical protein
MQAHESLTNHKAGLTKYQKIWHFCRTIWLLPFIWSLTWFSYWILRDIIFWHKSLSLINPANYAGAIISVALFLSAAYISGGIRSALASVRTQRRKIRDSSPFASIGSHTRRSIHLAPASVGTCVRRGVRSAFPSVRTPGRKTFVGLSIAGTYIRGSIRSALAETRRSIRSAFASFGAHSKKILVKIRAARGAKRTPISSSVQAKDTFQAEEPEQQMQQVNTMTEEPAQQKVQPQQPFSGVNVCPHNLDYFSQRPRPKQVPEQCIACDNLIQCVCLTNT